MVSLCDSSVELCQMRSATLDALLPPVDDAGKNGLQPLGLELSVIIGKPGRHVSRADAMDYVAGYSIFNDVTVRDYQFRITQYTAGKNFSRSGPFGPYLVLADEVADPHHLNIKTRLNGEIVQDGNTEEMLFEIPAIIEHLSEFIELEAGDVIPMGTPAGVGFTRTPPGSSEPATLFPLR